MSYIVTKIIKGNPYLYQYRCERIDGKPRTIYEGYLGRADKLGSTRTKPARDKLGSTPKHRFLGRLGSTVKRWWGKQKGKSAGSKSKKGG